MAHIQIKQKTAQQTNVEESVNAAIIHALYEHACGSDNLTSTLEGWIKSDHAYETEVQALRTKFPNLTINITDGYYVPFVDKTVERLIANSFGDGTGITSSQITSVFYDASAGNLTKYNANTSTYKLFSNNDNVYNTITSFEEFELFTGIVGEVKYNCTFNFLGLTDLRGHITIPSGITKISNNMFKNCGIDTVYFNNVTEISTDLLFGNAPNLKAVFYGKNTNIFSRAGRMSLPKVRDGGVAVFMNDNVVDLASQGTTLNYAGGGMWNFYVQDGENSSVDEWKTTNSFLADHIYSIEKIPELYKAQVTEYYGYTFTT